MGRPRVFRTEAIILRHMDYGEADRILTIFTLKFGKLRAIAKGIRRPTSKMGGHLELFNHAEVLLAKGRELDVVTQAVTLRAFPGLYGDLSKVAHAYQAAELVDAVVGERAESPRLFSLLLRTLAALDAGTHPRVTLRHFELRLLSVAGYQPQLQECLSCRQALEPRTNYLSYSLGGALCPGCGPREPTATPIRVDVLKVLRLLQRTETPEELRLTLPWDVLREVEQVLRTYLEHVLERRLRSPDLVARAMEIGRQAQTARKGEQRLPEASPTSGR